MKKRVADKKWSKVFVNGLVLLLVAGISGCGTFKSCKNYFTGQYKIVDYNTEVGSTHIAVLSVTPWDEIVNDLQPNFDMDENTALAQSLPTTTKFGEKIIDSMLGQVNFSSSLPGISSAAANSCFKNSLATQTTCAQDAAGCDPMMHYLAATSLFQEVRLLGSFVRNAANLSDDYSAYVVRLQVSVMPNARNMPYDTYVNISFLTSQPGKQIYCVSKSTGPDNIVKNDPVVVPLLVTDDLEAMSYSKSLESISQLGLLLSAVSGGANSQVNFQKLSDRLKTVSGDSYNSLLTVARVNDNTVRIRLGAMQQPGPLYVAVPMTHNISVLLLVPKTYTDSDKPKTIYVASMTNYWDIFKGKWLHNSPCNSGTNESIDRILKDYGFSVSSDTETTKRRALVLKMSDEVSINNDYDGFLKLYSQLSPNTTYPLHSEGNDADFYQTIQNFTIESVTQYTKFILPSDKPRPQTVIIKDNGKNTTADNLTAAPGVNYFLKITDNKYHTADYFPAVSTGAALTFPSLKLMNYQIGVSSYTTSYSVALHYQLPLSTSTADRNGDYKTRYLLTASENNKQGNK